VSSPARITPWIRAKTRIVPRPLNERTSRSTAMAGTRDASFCRVSAIVFASDRFDRQGQRRPDRNWIHIIMLGDHHQTADARLIRAPGSVVLVPHPRPHGLH
jgi:hypothetical protein